MEASVISDKECSFKKSSQGEYLLECYPRKPKCSEEIKQLCKDARNNSETNALSLERKTSFKELRKSKEDIDEVPHLKSRLGQMSLVMECKNDVPNRGDLRKEIPPTRKDEKRKRSTECVIKSIDGQPENIQLSEIKIQKWATCAPKQNDTEALYRIQQVCGAFEGDSMYHYENVDDFDDTENLKSPRNSNSKGSRLFAGGKSPISCKFRRNQDGYFLGAVSCEGTHSDDGENLRLYLLNQIARGVETVQCVNKGCTNFYDPWDVVLVVSTKDAHLWFETIAYDLTVRRQKGVIPFRKRSRQRFREKRDSTLATEALESEPNESWWSRKWKVKRIKVFKLPLNPDTKVGSVLVLGDKESTCTTEITSYKVVQQTFECTTCLEVYTDDQERSGLTCGHHTCKPCLNRYFKDQLYNMTASIECPRLDCKERFDTEFILNVLGNLSLQSAYKTLYDRRKDLDYKRKRSKSNNLLKNRLGSVAEKDPKGNQKPQITEPKTLANKLEDTETWMMNGNDFQRCPGCGTLTEKYTSDDSCNIVRCIFCKTTFCWICGKQCGEGVHVFHCPLFGNKRFSKKRIMANYVGYSVGMTIGVPLVGSLVIGTGAAALGTLIAIGTLSPPVLIARKIYNYHKLHRSSSCSTRLSVIGGAGLGVLVLPVLSAWGVYKTLNAASKEAGRFIKKLVPSEDDIYLESQRKTTAGRATKREINTELRRESPDDVEAKQTVDTQMGKKATSAITNHTSGEKMTCPTFVRNTEHTSST